MQTDVHSNLLRFAFRQYPVCIFRTEVFLPPSRVIWISVLTTLRVYDSESDQRDEHPEVILFNVWWSMHPAQGRNRNQDEI